MSVSTHLMLQTESDIEFWLRTHGVSRFNVNLDLSVNVQGDVDLNFKDISQLPVQFYRVTGHFLISGNPLRSLLGAPEIVNGYFVCDNTELTDLIGAPKTVHSFYCRNGYLKSLEGCPTHVNKVFDCSNNHLEHLGFCPANIENGYFVCDHNPKLGEMQKVEDFSEILAHSQIVREQMMLNGHIQETKNKAPSSQYKI